MIAVVALLLAMLILLGVAVGCFTISEWHRHEAAYWSNVAILVRLDPRLDEVHRPDLDWAKAHRPGVCERLRPWVPPNERRARAEAAS